MNPNTINRRQFFDSVQNGLYGAALASLLSRDLYGVEPHHKAPLPMDTRPRQPHFAPRAKAVIQFCMQGGPSQVDLFDPKPALEKFHGADAPEEFTKVAPAGRSMKGKVMRSHWKFARHGQSGAWVSNFMPHVGKAADDICFIKSMHTEQVNHAPAISFFMSGAEMPGRPTLGAWLSYGLGSDTDSLPSFVVMTSVSKGTTCGQIFYDFYWGSGFLPSRFQGVKFRAGGDPVLYLQNPNGITGQERRGMLDDLGKLNRMRHAEFGDPEILTRIAQYEMAYRMQTSVPELTDVAKEPKSVLDLYGPSVKERGSFAYNCLMARRLIERGTRFVQVMHAGWDQHRSVTTELYNQCRDTDQPSAGLIADLKQRGLLEDTLVVWGGEFGRTPFIQGDIRNRKQWGRDHHPYAFTTWMAGGGVKPGMTYGASDDLGINAVQDRVHVHDFQATLLHLLGIDHERFTYKFQGRRYRLTDVHGKVVKPILV